MAYSRTFGCNFSVSNVLSQTKVVYKIPCTNCSWCHIGETGRAFNTQKKKIWETSKLRPKVLELLITPGPTTTPLILKTRQLWTKALSEPENYYKRGIPKWHLTQITVLACYLQWEIQHSFLTNIHNYLHFYYFASHAFYSNFLIAFLSFILPIGDCSSGSRKLVVFNHFSLRSFLKF